MSNRYQTLDVSLNLNNSTFNKQTPKKLANTIDFGQKSQLSNIAENDQRYFYIISKVPLSIYHIHRVNKFRQLYFKNQKLRQQLKLLNVKLNQKLQKVKLMPSKKKKAMSVDLNVQKPTKALQRQLQNAYNQVAMYKKQIATLKVKQQSQSTYQKYKNLENQISFKDHQINQVQAQLKAIKNVKKMQQKTLVHDLQNQDLKDKLRQYQRQFKQGQQKLKQIAKKARKRQQQYKKQQAYQVALQTKLRKNNKQEQEQQQDQIQMNSNKQVSQQTVNQKDFQTIKQQIQKYKSDHQNYQKKLQIEKKAVKNLKKNRHQCQEKYKQLDIQIKGINLKIQSYKRLIKDAEKKGSQKQLNTGYGTTTLIDKQGSITGRQSSIQKSNLNQIESEDPSDQQSYMNYDKKSVPFNMSQPPSTVKDPRQWNGNARKVTFGYMNTNDSLHNITGVFRGIKAWTDEAQLICGLSFIVNENGVDKQSGVIGTRTSNELMWMLQPNDKLAYIDGSFTQQGYLAQFMLVSAQNLGARFGTQMGSNKFNCRIEQNEQISGMYCAVRRLGKDSRITQLGLWLNKKL